MKLLLYVTKQPPYLYGMYSGFETRYGYHLTKDKNVFNAHNVLNGKIIAECDFEVEEIKWEDFPKYNNDGNIEDFYMYATWKCPQDYILEHSCLTFEQLDNYLGKYKEGYAIYIKNLHIFDKPKELDEVYYKSVYSCEYYNTYEIGYHRMRKAPQNMMYVYDKDGKEKNILISIRPEWLCKILNGEKTIEVRKKVLKEML